MSDTLARIIEIKRDEVEALKARVPAEELKSLAAYTAPVRPFREALLSGPAPAVIAELKKASPSAGLLRADFSLETLCRAYVAGGAAAISVLTEKNFFQGEIKNLAAVREICGLPLLRKDFIFDEYQIHESRAAGADCILLIAAALTAAQLSDYVSLAHSIGLQVLVEVHDEEELSGALPSGADVVGVNNRNLKTLAVDIAASIELAPKIPPGVCKISESGIKTRDHVRRLMDAGYNGFLIGETLVTANDPAASLKELIGL